MCFFFLQCNFTYYWRLNEPAPRSSLLSPRRETLVLHSIFKLTYLCIFTVISVVSNNPIFALLGDVSSHLALIQSWYFHHCSNLSLLELLLISFHLPHWNHPQNLDQHWENFPLLSLSPNSMLLFSILCSILGEYLKNKVERRVHPRQRFVLH